MLFPAKKIDLHLICYFLCSLFFLLFFIGHNPYEINLLSALAIMAWGTMLFLLLGIVAVLLSSAIDRITGRENSRLSASILFMFLIVNFYGTVLVFQRIEAGMLATIAVACAVLGWLFVMSGKTGLKFTSVAAMVAGSISIVKYATAGILVGLSSTNSIPDTAGIEFKAKPNVYLISFDSLPNRGAYHQFFEKRDPLYIETLEAQSFRILDNTYAAAPETRTSINLLLAQSKNFYHGHLTSGAIKSLTYEIFRNNDYKIQFVNDSDYLGYDVGGIDYFYPKRQPLDVCRHANPNFLYGICSQVVHDLAVRLGIQAPGGLQVERLKQRIRVANSIPGQSWLTVSYIYYPGHTKPKSSWRDREYMAAYKADYENKQVQLSSYMRELVQEIKSVDKDPVIVLFGDHGPWLTRGAGWNPRHFPNESGYSYADAITDKYGVLIAAYPSDFCRDGLADNMSTLGIARAVIKCLSDGGDPLGKENTNKSYVGDKVVVEDGVILQ